MDLNRRLSRNGGEFGTAGENNCDAEIARRNRRGLANADSFAMHESKKSHDRSGQRKSRSLHEFPINYKYGDTLEDTITKLEYDLYYLKNFSVLMDVFILLRTVKIILFGWGSR